MARYEIGSEDFTETIVGWNRIARPPGDTDPTTLLAIDSLTRLGDILLTGLQDKMHILLHKGIIKDRQGKPRLHSWESLHAPTTDPKRVSDLRLHFGDAALTLSNEVEWWQDHLVMARPELGLDDDPNLADPVNWPEFYSLETMGEPPIPSLLLQEIRRYRQPVTLYGGRAHVA